MGSAEGLCPSAKSLSVSLRHKSFPLPARKRVREIVERVFQHPARVP